MIVYENITILLNVKYYNDFCSVINYKNAIVLLCNIFTSAFN